MSESRRGSRRASHAVDLETLGVKQELHRNFSTLSMLGLAFAILNSPTALSTSLNLALPSGGPSAAVWGLILAGVCNLCLAASLGEFLSAFPTAGGQYHWAALISWPQHSRWISFTTGWINVGAWVALTATGGLLGSTLILNVIALMHEEFESQPYQQFLIYIGFTLAAFLVNAFSTRILPLVTKTAFIWSLTGFVVISITVLACASPTYQEAKFVYGGFTNSTGWPDGMAWLLGLLQGAFALTGFDGVVHMIEEIPNPTVEGPKIMMYAIGIGMFTGWVLVSCLLFTLTNIGDVNSKASGPLLTILYQATGSKAGAVCLLMFPIICMLFTSTTLMTTSSRMSYAFARDRGLPFSKFFAKVHPTLEVPLNALIWTASWVIVFGLVLLGSDAAFSAIVSASVVALGVTYAIPPLINVLRGRSQLPENRDFKLPGMWGWVLNVIGILWTLLTTVLFVFPPELPATSTNMNYCIVAFGVILIIALLDWIFDGRKNYTGPRVDMESIKRGEIVDGLAVDTSVVQESGDGTDGSKNRND